MNCDRVFEILTRGPFPTGTSCDTPVEVHLSICPDCHRLAEALRPALELFQEAIGPEESRDLPGYWRDVAVERSQPIVSYVSQTEPSRAPRRAWTQQNLGNGFAGVAAWRTAAILALGLSAGLLLNSLGTLDGVTLPAIESPAHSRPVVSTPSGPSASERSELTVLPAACSRNRPSVVPRYSLRDDQMLAQADLANRDCCSECHNAQSKMAPKTATVEVTRRCQICHKD